MVWLRWKVVQQIDHHQFLKSHLTQWSEIEKNREIILQQSLKDTMGRYKWKSNAYSYLNDGHDKYQGELSDVTVHRLFYVTWLKRRLVDGGVPLFLSSLSSSTEWENFWMRKDREWKQMKIDCSRFAIRHLMGNHYPIVCALFSSSNLIIK